MGRTIAVIGAGISGMAFAHRALELSRAAGRPVSVRVYEAGPRSGGTLATERRDGFLLEQGADSFLSEKPWALELCKRIGLEDRLISTDPEFRRTLVARGDKLHALPGGFYLIAPRDTGSFLRTPLFSPMGKLRTLAERWVPARRGPDDESVASFIRRRFGAESLERVGQAMVAGVYSGDPEKLSILSTMPRFRQMEAEHGSVLRALRARGNAAEKEASGPRYSLFLSFKDGMQTLSDALENRIGQEAIRFHSKLSSLSVSADKKWTLGFEDGRAEQADAVCMAVPARTAAGWLRGISPELCAALDEVRYESTATLNFAYDAAAVSHPLNGFGFVVPRTEGRALMACTFVHRKFAGRAPKGKVLLRAFAGGAFGREVFERPDGELTAAVEKDLRLLLGIRKPPLFSMLTRYRSAMPQYAVGHQGLVSRIEQATRSLPGLFLTGSSYRGTGIPDCIHDAERQAESVLS